ncbi:hexokinase-2 isoform X2 [Lingula anatina]|uniref:Phosphotransferase n=1 Tax=Lingula anatina TaxID=7574 RepID=A0A1S3HXZ9_LINAN|nr:hexokinase-2 isoform X2 [Lingula anatina]|eukprot:XP_013390907.1 hexokinase-2 isoform X2 [Lingula anatina]
MHPTIHGTTMDDKERVERIVEELKLSDVQLRKVMQLLDDEMNKGLCKGTNPNAAIKMFPTYVRSIPDGTEEGNYLALDLGGTNFRVLLIRLNGSEVSMRSKIFLVPNFIMTGTAEELFDHIAECISKFMHEEGIADQKLPLGFTFSFPCKQEGLARARLSQWTKGFKVSGVEGEDIVRLLHEAIERRDDIDVECVAVINDTVGAQISCAHEDRNCQIGLILGTGSNACYMEQLDKVETWDGDERAPRQVIINTEWGAFGDNGVLDFIRTQYDQELDAKFSVNPGKQLYEKMMSGMYLGELARLYLERLVNEGLLFEGQSSDLLSTPGRFYTKYISEIESDKRDDFKNTKSVLEYDLGIENYSNADCHYVQYVCSLVSSRAAHLASCGCAVLLNRVARPSVTIAVDGSLYRFHPKFGDIMEQKVSQLVNKGLKFKIMLSHDGSGKGAALVAAVACRIRDEQKRNGLI